MKSRVHLKYKTTYRVGNWREYERALVQRGDVTLWLSAAATDAWRPSPSGRPGGQKRFSDVAIETALILRLVFGLPLRQTEGFVRSVLALMGADLDAPDHTTLSRRSQPLAVMLRRIPALGPIHLIVDSTGLSIVGQGAWGRRETRGTRQAWMEEAPSRRRPVGCDRGAGPNRCACRRRHDCRRSDPRRRWRHLKRHSRRRLRHDRGLRGGGRARCEGCRATEADRRRVSPPAAVRRSRSYRQADAGRSGGDGGSSAMAFARGVPQGRRRATIGRRAWRMSSSGTSRSSAMAFARGVPQGRGLRRSSRATC